MAIVPRFHRKRAINFPDDTRDRERGVGYAYLDTYETCASTAGFGPENNMLLYKVLNLSYTDTLSGFYLTSSNTPSPLDQSDGHVYRITG